MEWNLRMGLLPRLCDGFDGEINFATGSTGRWVRRGWPPSYGWLFIDRFLYGGLNLMKTRLMHLQALFVWGLFFAIAGTTSAQQVVQQPTIGSLSINSSVLVPDQGSAFLGGTSSAGAGQSQRGGLVTNRAFGNRSAWGGASVSATIIDLQEMDRAILQLADRTQSLSKQTESDARSLPSIQVKGMSEADLEDVHYFLTLAQNARRLGHWASIDVYLQLAKSKIPVEKQTKLLSHYGFSETSETSKSKPGQASKNKSKRLRP